VTIFSSKATVISEIKKRGFAKTGDLERIGASRQQVRRMARSGEIERVAWGLYRLPSAVPSQWQSYAEVSRRVPRGVICLLSALRFHELTTQNPWEVWVAIEGRSWRPPRGNPPIQIVHASGPAFRKGIERHRVGGTSIRVYGVAKTIADCFKYRRRVGLEVALEALRDGWRDRKFTMEEIDRFARICRVQRVMQPYLEATVA